MTKKAKSKIKKTIKQKFGKINDIPYHQISDNSTWIGLERAIPYYEALNKASAKNAYTKVMV